MSISLRGLVSREVTELPEGVEKILRFKGAVVVDLSSGREVEILGPVDLDKFGSRTMSFTDAVTGEEKSAQGITLIVVEEDGQPVSKPLNIISKRLIQALHGDLETGNYLKNRYHITAIDPAPKTRYQISREPIAPAPAG